MKKRTLIVMTIVVLSTASVLLAVCGQNSDVIYLYSNGERIINSDIVLVEKQKNSTYKIASYCIDGTCFSRFFSGDVSNVFFVQVSDKVLLKKMKDAISATENSVVKGNSGFDKSDEITKLYTSDELTAANTQLNSLVAGKIDSFKRYPFLSINSVKNNFNYNNCSYIRLITYDLTRKTISVKEKGGQ